MLSTLDLLVIKGKNILWVKISTLLGLWGLCRHGYNHKHIVKIMEPLWSWLIAVGNEKTVVSRSLSLLILYVAPVLITVAISLSHLYVNICSFGACAGRPLGRTGS